MTAPSRTDEGLPSSGAAVRDASSGRLDNLGFSTYVALRFLKSPRSRFVSVVTTIALLGIGLGVAALNITLAAMNGFRDQIQFKFVESMPMVTVLTANPRGFTDLEGAIADVQAMEGVEGVSPFIRSPVLLTLERRLGRPLHTTAIAWGIDAGRQESVTPLSESIHPPFRGFDTSELLGGSATTPGIVLGSELAQNLVAGVGDLVTLTAPRKTGGSLEDMEGVDRDFMVVGILSTGMYEFDANFVYVDLAMAQHLFEKPGGADGIGVKVDDMMRAEIRGEEIQAALGRPFYTNDWINLNSELFKWIRYEKVMMFLLLLLMTIVGSFGVVAILIMTVQERQRDIGILLSIGVSRRRVAGVFVRLGIVLGVVGILCGTAFGMLACWVFDTVGIPLPGGVYFVDTLPIHVKGTDVALVAAAAFVISLLATLIPSGLASRFTPVEVLRYE